jgi:hypothetical protein
VDWWFESISKVKLALDQFCIGVILGHDPEAMAWKAALLGVKIVTSWSKLSPDSMVHRPAGP